MTQLTSMKTSPALVVVLSILVTCVIQTPPSHAQETTRPRVLDSFGVGELTLATGALVGFGLITLWGDEWIGAGAPSMGAPAEGSNDLRFSRWANPNFDPKTQWMGGAPDLTGYVAPALALSYYVGGSVISGGRGWRGAHPHEAIAFTEGLSWAMLSTMFLKHFVGRERPYVIRGRMGELNSNEVNMKRSEQMLSFPSGHSTMISATTFFIAADLSDALVMGPLKDQSPWLRTTTGRVLPYMTAGVISWVVMYSRIKDQRHWLSDTLTGGLIGATSALLSYHMHFDSRGEPY